MEKVLNSTQAVSLIDSLRKDYRSGLIGKDFSEMKQIHDRVFSICKEYKIKEAIIQMDQAVYDMMDESIKLSYFGTEGI